MKTLTRKTLESKALHELCEVVGFNSRLSITSSENCSLAVANQTLADLIKEGLLNPGSHLQQGIHSIQYNEGNVFISEIPLQYPDKRLIEATEKGVKSKGYLGPHTGIFVHVFQDDLYAFHIRGNHVVAPGKLQIVAGQGEYSIYPSALALKEVDEEINVTASLVLEPNRFMDITPFIKSGRFPQPLFSYIVTGKLSNIKNVITREEELQKFRGLLPADRQKEAYPFLVPLEKLRDLISSLNDERFYGPVKRTAINFLSWYNEKFKKSF